MKLGIFTLIKKLNMYIILNLLSLSLISSLQISHLSNNRLIIDNDISYIKPKIVDNLDSIDYNLMQDTNTHKNTKQDDKLVKNENNDARNEHYLRNQETANLKVNNSISNKNNRMPQGKSDFNNMITKDNKSKADNSNASKLNREEDKLMSDKNKNESKNDKMDLKSKENVENATNNKMAEEKLINKDRAKGDIKTNENHLVEKEDNISNKDKNDNKEDKDVQEKISKLETTSNDIKNKIKLQKIEIFGEENASLDYYIKNKSIYNREYLSKIEKIVNLLELIEEYEFMKKESNSNGGKIIDFEKGSLIDQLKKEDIEEKNDIKTIDNKNNDDKFDNKDAKSLNYRKENTYNSLLKSKRNDDSTGNKTINDEHKSKGLNVSPAAINEKYIPLSEHDTVKIQNSIKVKNLK